MVHMWYFKHGVKDRTVYGLETPAPRGVITPLSLGVLYICIYQLTMEGVWPCAPSLLTERDGSASERARATSRRHPQRGLAAVHRR